MEGVVVVGEVLVGEEAGVVCKDDFISVRHSSTVEGEETMRMGGDLNKRTIGS